MLKALLPITALLYLLMVMVPNRAVHAAEAVKSTSTGNAIAAKEVSERADTGNRQVALGLSANEGKTDGTSTPAASHNDEDRDWKTLADETSKQLAESTDALQWNRYGYYLFRAGESHSARKAYEKSLELQPDYSIAWNNLGVLHLSTQEYAAAEHCFRQALRLEPLNAKVRFNLAVSAFRQGRYYEALRGYLQLRAEAPAYVELRSDRRKAELELARALKKDPNDPVLREVARRVRVMKSEKGAYEWR